MSTAITGIGQDAATVPAASTTTADPAGAGSGTTTAPGAASTPNAAATATTAGTAATGTLSAASTATPSAGAGGFGLDKDAFLKILVEQLRHQDPSQPGDSQQYIQQMTQFSMLEQLSNISQAVQVQHADTAASTAMGLVGRAITYKDGETEHSGVVERVSFGSDGPTLTVSGVPNVKLGAISEIR